MENKKRGSNCKRLLQTVIMGVSLFYGCASVPIPEGISEANGDLMPCRENPQLLWWEKPGFSWHEYQSVMLDPILIQDDSSGTRLTKAQRDSLAQYFRQSVTDRLAGQIPVVDQPGPHVLRIRGVVTDVDTASPVFNIVTTAALFIPMDTGGAQLDVTFLDAQTNELMAALVERKTGSRFHVKNGFIPLGHVRQAFDQWAEDLRQALASNP